MDLPVAPHLKDGEMCCQASLGARRAVFQIQMEIPKFSTQYFSLDFFLNIAIRGNGAATTCCLGFRYFIQCKTS